MASSAYQEAKLSKLGKELKSLVVADKYCSISALHNNYREQNGAPIPFSDFGYKNLQELIGKLPEYVYLKGDFVYPITSAKSAHLEDLISRTKSKQPKAIVRAPLFASPRHPSFHVRGGNARGGFVGGTGGFVPASSFRPTASSFGAVSATTKSRFANGGGYARFIPRRFGRESSDLPPLPTTRPSADEAIGYGTPANNVFGGISASTSGNVEAKMDVVASCKVNSLPPVEEVHRFVAKTQSATKPPLERHSRGTRENSCELISDNVTPTLRPSMPPSSFEGRQEFKQIIRKILLECPVGISQEDLTLRFRQITGASVESYGCTIKELLTEIKKDFGCDVRIEVDFQTIPMRVIYIPEPTLLRPASRQFGGADMATSSLSLPMEIAVSREELWRGVRAAIRDSGVGGLLVDEVQTMLGISIEETYELLMVQHKNEFDIDFDDVTKCLLVCSVPLEIPVCKLPNVDRLNKLADDDFDSRFCLIRMSCFESMSEFYVQCVLADGTNHLDELENDMARYFNTSNNTEVFGTKTPQLGMYFICFVVSTQRFYRCRIMEVDLNGGLVLAYFIDFGYKEFVPIKDMRPMVELFSHLPAQAICVAFDLQPPNNYGFDMDKIRLVYQSVIDRSVDGKLWAYMDRIEQGRLFVDLYVDTAGGALFASTAFQDAGLVQPIDMAEPDVCDMDLEAELAEVLLETDDVEQQTVVDVGDSNH